ncbi:hypothetical protein OG563_26625 [Nocardia vinacea]|uniref:Uncharacterized protein n=1 Tax=Nocardia vinacea TaxID=96468 RepID=A0ABZ1YKL9_9NOCA|nr:hypothetical protein [Nocardia vinacea]
MTIYATLMDLPYRNMHHEPPGERREFDDRRAVDEWFDNYLNGFTGEADASGFAQVKLHGSQLGSEIITTLVAAENPDGSYRVVDKRRGDKIERGAIASGISLMEAMAGYLGAQLLAAGLLDDFGVGDVPVTYRATVLLGIRYMAGRHPLATRIWLQRHSSREFGAVLFLDQTTDGGFWRSTGGRIDGVDATLECYALYFRPNPLHVVDGQLHIAGFSHEGA